MFGANNELGPPGTPLLHPPGTPGQSASRGATASPPGAVGSDAGGGGRDGPSTKAPHQLSASLPPPTQRERGQSCEGPSTKAPHQLSASLPPPTQRERGQSCEGPSTRAPDLGMAYPHTVERWPHSKDMAPPPPPTQRELQRERGQSCPAAANSTNRTAGVS